MSTHTTCLNCGNTIAAHNPDDLHGCGNWWPSTLPPTDRGAA